MDSEEKKRIREVFLIRLSVQFRKPASETETAHKRWLLEVSRQVSKFPTPVLERAADLILQREKSVRWPAISTLFQACVEARNELDPDRPVKSTGTRKPGRLPEPVAIEIALKADRALTLNAVEGGWHGRLIDHVREHRALPDEQGQERLYQETVTAWKALQTSNASQAPGSIVNRSLQCLASKRARLAEDIFQIHRQLQDKGAYDAKAENAG